MEACAALSSLFSEDENNVNEIDDGNILTNSKGGGQNILRATINEVLSKVIYVKPAGRRLPKSLPGGGTAS